MEMIYCNCIENYRQRDLLPSFFKINTEERSGIMEFIPTECLEKLGNEDILTLAWNCTPNKVQSILLLHLSGRDYILLDLVNPQLDTFGAFEREIQTLDEIRDFLEYLLKSHEANLEFLGSFRNRETLIRLLPVVKKQIPQVNDLSSLESYLLGLRERVLAYYRIYRQVQVLPFKTGDIIITLSPDRQPINREKLIQHERGYMLLPTEWESVAIDDELMSKEVLCEYLFALLVEEHCILIFSHSTENGTTEETVLECGSFLKSAV